MKRAFVLCLAVLMAVSALTGCAETAATSDETVTVTVWTNNYHDKSFVMEKVNEWNSTVGKDKKIRIDYQVKDDIEKVLEVALISGQGPDMFPILGGSLEKYATEGWIEAIEDLPGGRELIARFDGMLSYNKHIYDGKTYILPNSSTTYGLVYNKDMFAAAGLVDEEGEAKPPATLEELREFARILTNPDKNEYGIIFPAKYGDWFSDDVMKPATGSTRCFGYDPVTGRYDYGSLVDMMTTLMEIKADGSCVPGADSLDNDPARSRFADGGIGMYFSASYDYSVFTTQFPAKIDWGVAPYPVSDPADARKQYTAYNRYIAINKASVEKIGAARLMEVYRWFYSEEMMAEAYVEGINLPTDKALVTDNPMDKDKIQWQEYAALLEVSAATPMQQPYDITGLRTPAEIWEEDIWSGKTAIADIPKVCDEMSEIMNEGVRRYQELHPEFDPSQLIVPEWEETSKR